MSFARNQKCSCLKELSVPETTVNNAISVHLNNNSLFKKQSSVNNKIMIPKFPKLICHVLFLKQQIWPQVLLKSFGHACSNESGDFAFCSVYVQ